MSSNSKIDVCKCEKQEQSKIKVGKKKLFICICRKYCAPLKRTDIGKFYHVYQVYWGFLNLEICFFLCKSLINKQGKIGISVQKCAADSTTHSDSDATISYSDSDGELYFFTESGRSDIKMDDNRVSDVKT